MPSNRKWGAVAVALLALFILGSIATSLYQSGWSQGYLFGVLASGDNSSALLAPYMLHGRGVMPFFAGVGWIFRFALFALLFMAIAKAFRCFAGRGGMGPGGWRHHWHHEGHHGNHHDAEREGHRDVHRQEQDESTPTRPVANVGYRF